MKSTNRTKYVFYVQNTMCKVDESDMFVECYLNQSDDNNGFAQIVQNGPYKPCISHNYDGFWQCKEKLIAA